MIRRSCLLILAIIFIGVVGLILWIRHGEYWAIDSCLDSGGAWNYATKECQH
jgi:hypothetical protein